MEIRIQIDSMETTLHIFLAGIVGTSVMTLYSYWMSELENRQYREPELLNGLVKRSEYLNDRMDIKTFPAGWAAHYLIGITFAISYFFIWPKSLYDPTTPIVLAVGSASGIIGVIELKIFFLYNNPPDT